MLNFSIDLCLATDGGNLNVIVVVVVDVVVIVVLVVVVCAFHKRKEIKLSRGGHPKYFNAVRALMS